MNKVKREMKVNEMKSSRNQIQIINCQMFAYLFANRKIAKLKPHLLVQNNQ